MLLAISSPRLLLPWHPARHPGCISLGLHTLARGNLITRFIHRPIVKRPKLTLPSQSSSGGSSPDPPIVSLVSPLTCYTNPGTEVSPTQLLIFHSQRPTLFKGSPCSPCKVQAPVQGRTVPPEVHCVFPPAIPPIICLLKLRGGQVKCLLFRRANTFSRLAFSPALPSALTIISLPFLPD